MELLNDNCTQASAESAARKLQGSQKRSAAATPIGEGTSLKNYLTFLMAGTFFSTVEEFLTVVILRRDVPAYVFTLIVLFPVFLTFVFLSGRIVDRLLLGHAFRDPAHFLIYASVGLLIEWFAIGLSPWSNPDANLLLMALFQLGMFSFWGTVAFAPRLFIRGDALSVRTRRTILRFYLPYFFVVYLTALTVPEQLRFGATIVLILIGYYVVVILLVRYFRQSLLDLRLESSTSSNP